MPGSVFGRALWIRRHAILGWAGGVAAAGALTMAVFPAVRDSDAFQELIAKFPAGLLKFFGIDPKLFTTAVGFLQAQLYGFIAPTIMIAYAIGIGASATAAEEDNGTADLLLAHPVSRARVLLEQLAALAVLTGALAAMFALVLVVGNSVADFGIAGAANLGTNLGLWLLGLFFGSLAMMFGAWRGRRGGAVGSTIAVAVSMFFINFLAPPIGLEGLDRFTAFYWFYNGQPLLNGANPGMLVLAAGALVLFVVTVWIFARRDVGIVGERPRRTRDGRPIPETSRVDFLLDSVYGQSLWRRRHSIWWWTLGLCLLAGLSAGFWPTLSKGAEQLEGLLELVPREVFAAFGVSDPAMVLTPAGFLNSRVYGSLGLIVMVVFAIAMGTAEIAGDIRRGTMDVLLSTPVRRGKLVLQRWAAMATLIAVASACLGLVVATFNAILGLGLPAIGLLAANAGFALLVLFFGTLALAVGSATGSVAAARGVPAVVAVASFLFNAFGATSPAFGALKLMSPLHWYLGEEPPLARGFSPDMSLLAGGVVVLGALAVAGFARRDVVSG
ncbi:MAG: ABC transporter permease subunit [Planctomycetota bacterium]|jgi:ABC-2 type transport system permease protein